MTRLVYLVVGWAAVALGTSVVHRQFQKMDEQDQDQAVAHYLNLRLNLRDQRVFEKTPELKDKMTTLVQAIKSRWHKTPDELIRHFYHRHQIFTIRLPGLDKDRVLSPHDGAAGRPHTAKTVSDFEAVVTLPAADDKQP